MTVSVLTRVFLAGALACAMGCTVKPDAASQQQIDDIIAATEASAARAEEAAGKAEASASSASASADRAAAAAQKADAILSRTLQK